MVRAKLDVFDVGDLEDLELFFADGFPSAFPEKFAFEFLPDLLLEAFFDQGTRDFALAETFHAHRAAELKDEFFAGFLDALRFEFDAEGCEAVGKGFDDDVHLKKGIRGGAKILGPGKMQILK
jgi:hypothetical protein